MIVILKASAPEAEIQALCRRFEAEGLSIHASTGEHTRLLGLIGDTSRVDVDAVMAIPIVESVRRVSEPYKSVMYRHDLWRYS